MNRVVKVVACVACALMVGTVAMSGQGARTGGKLSADTRAKLMDALNKGETYLRQNQQADGRWEKHPGITALVITALVRQPGKDKAAQVKSMTTALDSLVALAKPDGGIYEGAIPHYITAVSVTALAAAGRPQHNNEMLPGRDYRVENQHEVGVGEGKADCW